MLPETSRRFRPAALRLLLINGFPDVSPVPPESQPMGFYAAARSSAISPRSWRPKPGSRHHHSFWIARVTPQAALALPFAHGDMHRHALRSVPPSERNCGEEAKKTGEPRHRYRCSTISPAAAAFPSATEDAREATPPLHRPRTGVSRFGPYRAMARPAPLLPCAQSCRFLPRRPAPAGTHPEVASRMSLGGMFCRYIAIRCAEQRIQCTAARGFWPRGFRRPPPCSAPFLRIARPPHRADPQRPATASA